MNTLKPYHLLILVFATLLIITTACSGARAPEAAEAPAEEQAIAQDVAVEYEAEAMEEAVAGAEVTQDPLVETEAVAAEPATDAAGENGTSPIANRPDAYNRLIIKNGEVELLVENTDTAINRALGIVTEYQGYVVSNRTWFSGEEKYATLTIGVPAENFEEMLRRLKDLAISVTNETISGQDVTDEFVDLGSRLQNLEATAARIREFLDQAVDVEESLEVSTQLSEIEAEIEQVKGRMNYIKDRAAFSTITLQISPQILAPTPTPTFTPTPTPTPTPWSPTHAFNDATTTTGKAATSLFQTAVDLTIWFVIVILPFGIPIVGFFWLIVRILRRFGVDTSLRPPSV